MIPLEERLKSLTNITDVARLKEDIQYSHWHKRMITDMKLALSGLSLTHLTKAIRHNVMLSEQTYHLKSQLMFSVQWLFFCFVFLTGGEYA